MTFTEDVINQVVAIHNNMEMALTDFMLQVENDEKFYEFIEMNPDASSQLARLFYLAATMERYEQLKAACVDRSSRMDVINKLREHVKSINPKSNGVSKNGLAVPVK